MGVKGTPVYLTDKDGGNVLDITADGKIQVSGSLTPTGTQDVNLKEVGAAAIAFGQAAMAGSVPVVIASNQSKLGVNLNDGSGASITLGQKTKAGSFPVTVASDSGLATAANQTSLSAKFGALGQKAMAGSAPVVLASDQASIPVKNQDGVGNAITGDDWLARGEKRSLSVNVLSGPNVSIVNTLVQPGDIGADYVSGSEGQIKTLKEYPTGAGGGTAAKLTTFKYADAQGPTVPTSIVETATTV